MTRIASSIRTASLSIKSHSPLTLLSVDTTAHGFVQAAALVQLQMEFSYHLPVIHFANDHDQYCAVVFWNCTHVGTAFDVGIGRPLLFVGAVWLLHVAATHTTLL
jgi:hypothetical protein